jgi:ankyrin repeat protein
MSWPSFLSLPTELHNLILSHLTQACSLYAVSQTCRYLSILVAPYLFNSAVNAKDSYALRWATSVNNTELMTRLLRAGVDVTGREIGNGYSRYRLEEPRGLKYKTALRITLEVGHTDALKILLDHGGAVRSQLLEGSLLLVPVSRGDLPMLEILLEYILSDERSDNGTWVWDDAWDDAVTEAIRSGKIETVEFFLDCGFEFSDPLHQATSEGHIEIARLLLERGVIEDIGGRSLGWDDMTPMDLAAKEGHVHLMELLLGNGAEIDCTSDEGIQPVHRAAESGGDDAVKFLAQNGADVNAPSIDGTTPIHLAARYYQYSTLEVLIDMGGDVNTTDYQGRAALYHAARATEFHEPYNLLTSSPYEVRTYGIDLAWLLLKNGAILDQQDQNGWTAMDVAVQGGRIGMARTLLMARKMEGIEYIADNLEGLYDHFDNMDRDYRWFGSPVV